MELRQLEAVREVVATGSVTGAAAVLHCTPSAVSQQVRIAERLAGTTLFERDGRGVRPTPAGLALAARAVDVAVAVERARAAVAEHAARPTGVVRVSAFQSAAELLFPLLLGVAARHDGVEVECVEQDVTQDAFVPLTASADVVVAHRPARSVAFADVGLRIMRLMREPLDVALPRDHPLADREEIGPADLAREPWITVQEGFPIAKVVDELAARSGSVFTVRHRINDFHVTAALVAAGQGVALLPRYCTDVRPVHRVVLRPLRGLRPARLVEALVRADRAERRVVQTVLQDLQEQAAGVVAAYEDLASSRR
ncbi:MAG: LysR family transcriptional regulator [Janthinobacterium lividum]